LRKKLPSITLRYKDENSGSLLIEYQTFKDEVYAESLKDIIDK